MTTPTPLQRRQTGYRLPAGEWFNLIIDRVNAMISGTVNFNDLTIDDDLTVGGDVAITGDMTVDDITMDDLTADSVATGDFVQNGISTFTGQSIAAAGATQGTATAITKSSVYVVTVTASTRGIKLPTAAEGKRVTIFGHPTVGVKVYPFSGDKIGAAATNTAVVLASAKGNIYQAIDGTTWRVVKGA